MKNQLVSNSSFINSVENTDYLIPGSWREKTTLLLSGSQDIDKTEIAIEVARAISAGGSKVAYINAADTLQNYAKRLDGIDNLSVLNPVFDPDDENKDFADSMIAALEAVIAETDIKIYIIDSLSRLAALSYGRNASVTYVMKRLVNLQMRTGCSFLVISHDSTKSVDRALVTLANGEYQLTDVLVSNKLNQTTSALIFIHNVFDCVPDSPVTFKRVEEGENPVNNRYRIERAQGGVAPGNLAHKVAAV